MDFGVLVEPGGRASLTCFLLGVSSGSESDLLGLLVGLIIEFSLDTGGLFVVCIPLFSGLVFSCFECNKLEFLCGFSEEFLAHVLGLGGCCLVQRWR